MFNPIEYFFGDLKKTIKNRVMMHDEPLLESLQKCLAEFFEKDFTKYYLIVAKQFKNAANLKDMH